MKLKLLLFTKNLPLARVDMRADQKCQNEHPALSIAGSECHVNGTNLDASRPVPNNMYDEIPQQHEFNRHITAHVPLSVYLSSRH